MKLHTLTVKIQSSDVNTFRDQISQVLDGLDANIATCTQIASNGESTQWAVESNEVVLVNKADIQPAPTPAPAGKASTSAEYSIKESKGKK